MIYIVIMVPPMFSVVLVLIIILHAVFTAGCRALVMKAWDFCWTSWRGCCAKNSKEPLYPRSLYVFNSPQQEWIKVAVLEQGGVKSVCLSVFLGFLCSSDGNTVTRHHDQYCIYS